MATLDWLNPTNPGALLDSRYGPRTIRDGDLALTPAAQEVQAPRFARSLDITRGTLLALGVLQLAMALCLFAGYSIVPNKPTSWMVYAAQGIALILGLGFLGMWTLFHTQRRTACLGAMYLCAGMSATSICAIVSLLSVAIVLVPLNILCMFIFCRGVLALHRYEAILATMATNSAPVSGGRP